MLCVPADVAYYDTPETLTRMIESATASINESRAMLRHSEAELNRIGQVASDANRGRGRSAQVGHIDSTNDAVSALQAEIELEQADIAYTQSIRTSLERRYDHAKSPLRQSREQYLAAVEQAVMLHNEVGIIVSVSLGYDQRTRDYIRRWTMVDRLLSGNADFEAVKSRKEGEQMMRNARRAAATRASSSKIRERKARR